MLKKLIYSLDNNTQDVLKKSFKTFFVRLIALFSGLFISLFLGRVLGASGLGIINFSNKLLITVTVISTFGFQNVIIKLIAIAKSNSNKQEISSVLKTSLLFNLSIATLITILFLIIIKFNVEENIIPFLLLTMMIIPFTISRIFLSALNGIGEIWKSAFFDQTFSLLIVVLGIFFLSWSSYDISVINIMVLYLISRCIVAITSKFIWTKSQKNNLKGKIVLNKMLSIAKPMLLISGSGIIWQNLDAIILGFFTDYTNVGIYTVAGRLALLTALILQVTNSAISPKLASLYNQSKLTEIKIMVKKVTRLLTVFGLLSIVFFIFFGKIILGFWGNEFVEGYYVLLILCFGQFINISTGCSGMVLMMCGYEKDHGKISVLTLFLNIILNIVLIYYYGIVGAAVASAFTVGVGNILKVIIAKRRTGVLTISF